MLTRRTPETMPFDEFRASLQSVCGRFEVTPSGTRDTVRAHVCCETRAGLEMATIAKDVHSVRRTEADIRANPGEHVFLIVQEEGQTLMQQNGRTALMTPGDMILIDSTCPSEFTSFGKYMRHLSLHLDRREIVSRLGNVPFCARSIRRDDRHAIALSAIIGSAFAPETSDRQSSFLKDAIFGVLGAAFCENDGGHPNLRAHPEISTAQILENAMAFIDSRFTDGMMSPAVLAAELGVSLRNLQRAFAFAGMTPSDYLIWRRLERACLLLNERQKKGAKTLVSTIAYESGFNDVSYFNRQFRRSFGCAPGQYPGGS
jgi:AraC family transcriptional regulator, positive regulator of tynA and feaB